MKLQHLLFLFLLCLFSCAEPAEKSPVNTSAADSFAVIDSAAGTTIARLPAALLLGKKGIPTDTFSSLSLRWLRADLDRATPFPGGIASLQLPLGDTLLYQCGTGKRRCEMLRDTLASFFDSINVRRVYIGLFHIDPAAPQPGGLDYEDCDYSLLRFLRYRCLLEKTAFYVKDTTEEYVNPVELRTIHFRKPLQLLICENNRHYSQSVSYWRTAWQCHERIDYAPPFAYLNPMSTPLKGKYTWGNDGAASWNDSIRIIWEERPEFVPFILPLQEKDAALKATLDSLGGSTIAMRIKSVGGNAVEGTGIDLDKDRVPDIFWYRDPRVDMYYTGWNCWMYLNIGGHWVPYWYRVHYSLA
jgi:hypothetical protein